MDYTKFSTRVNTKLTGKFSSEKRIFAFLEQLEKDPKSLLLKLIKADSETSKLISLGGKHQFVIIAAQIEPAVVSLAQVVSKFNVADDNQRFFVNRAVQLTTRSITDDLELWYHLVVTSQHNPDSPVYACRAAMDDLQRKLADWQNAREAQKAACGQKPVGGNLAGGFAQTLGADEVPGSGGNDSGGNCTDATRSLEVAADALATAVHNLPLACPQG